jgi:hypothetical protein
MCLSQRDHGVGEPWKITGDRSRGFGAEDYGNMVIVGNHRFSIRSFLEKQKVSKKNWYVFAWFAEHEAMMSGVAHVDFWTICGGPGRSDYHPSEHDKPLWNDPGLAITPRGHLQRAVFSRGQAGICSKPNVPDTFDGALMTTRGHTGGHLNQGRKDPNPGGDPRIPWGDPAGRSPQGIPPGDPPRGSSRGIHPGHPPR